MKDKINVLITECLGELFMIPRTALKQEQQKRELLAGLIEIERCYELLINCSPMRSNVKLIEKTLNRKWFEIVKYLEGEEG